MESRVLDYRSPLHADDALPAPAMLVWSRVACAMGAVALPLLCIWAAAEGGYIHAPEWQSAPAWRAYVQLVPVPEVGWPFYPLLAYAMLSALAVVAAPRRAAQFFFIRFGLITGILLSVQYGVIYTLGSGLQPMMMFLLGGLVALLVASLLLRLIPARYRTAAALLLLTLPLATLAARFGLRRAVFYYFWLLAAAPAITGFSYLVLAEVTRPGAQPVPPPHPSRRWRVLLPLAWLASWAAAWKGSMALAAAKYATLPTTAPNCYVATAAARGHHRFVRAEPALTAAGVPYLANAQLRRLKRFEILLCILAPAAHRRIRAIYDRLGPRLARRLTHPLAADAAYVLLKPAEWIFGGVASVLLPVCFTRRGSRPSRSVKTCFARGPDVR